MKTLNVLSAIMVACVLPVIAPAQTTTTQTEAAFGLQTERPTTASAADGGENPRLRPAPQPKAAPEGTVWPTAAGKLGGATSATQAMPTDVEGLIEWRRPFTNRPEFRAAWVTRFDWAGRGKAGEDYDAEACKKRIVDYMEAAKQLRLNAIIFQVRGEATTLYPSTLEPWSQLVGGKDPGFDPCQFAIDEAHKRGLEFHAYINPIPCTEEKTSTPASQDHIFYKHCMPDSAPHWLVHQDGKVLHNDTYRWFNPNLPEVQTYIRQTVMDLVKRYDIDGVHYDRIRLPSPEVSDDQWSKARFAETNPHNLTYQQWQTENISNLVADLYGAIMEIKPHVKVTASVWGIYDNTTMPQGEERETGYSWTSSGLQDYAQDSVGWANEGSMDGLVPMIYWSMGDLKPDYDDLLEQFMNLVHNGRHIYGGLRVFAKEEMIRQVVATNVLGAHGTVPFTLERISSETMREFYRKHIYPTEVKVPEMPWKTNPVYGHVIVTVVDKAGKPVTDAQVKLAGREHVYLSTTEGTCAVLNVVPGEVELSGSLKGSDAPGETVTVTAGKVSRVKLTVGAEAKGQ